MSCLQQERRQNDVSLYTRRAAPTSTPTSPRSGPFVDGFPLHTLIFELIDFEGLVWVRLALLRRGILFVALAPHRHQPLCVLLYQTAARLYPKVPTTTGTGPGSLRGAIRKEHRHHLAVRPSSHYSTGGSLHYSPVSSNLPLLTVPSHASVIAPLRLILQILT